MPNQFKWVERLAIMPPSGRGTAQRMKAIDELAVLVNFEDEDGKKVHLRFRPEQAKKLGRLLDHAGDTALINADLPLPERTSVTGRLILGSSGTDVIEYREIQDEEED